MNQEDRILYIDADTVLYSSAAQEQKLKCLAKHLPTGRDKLFESKTQFNEWLKENPRWDIKDFEFEVIAELYGQAEFAFRNINRKIDAIVRASGCKEYFVCIQGSGNFRNDYESEFVDYKAHRQAKPILYPQCFEFVQRKFKERCIVTSGIETDDFVCQKGWESFNASGGDPEKAKHVIAYVDKDIPANTPGLLLNYNKLEDGVFWNSRTEQVKKFLTQVLTGDKADAIPGIKLLGPATKKLHGISHKGCGPVNAGKILNYDLECQMARNVVEAYKESHPTDWLQRMTDSCFFLYLQQYEGDQFDVHKLFNGFGVTL